MDELLLSNKVLKLVIEEDRTFKDAIKVVFSGEGVNKELSPTVSALTGCELRHHLFLEKITKDLDLGEYKYVLSVALANNFFLKRFDKAQITKELKRIYKDKYDERMEKLVNHEDAALSLLGDADHTSIDFVSLRFNVPTYLLKMWFKHFGKSLTYKVLKKNIKPSSQYLRINTMRIDEDSFLKEHPTFIKSIVNDIVILPLKTNVHKMEEYKNYDIFNERLGLKLIMDKVWNSSLEEITLYVGDDKAIIRDAYVRSLKKVGIHVAINNVDEHPDLLRLIRLEKCKNVTYFEPKDYSLMDFAITSPQDLVVVYPKSSSFDKIRKYPDYLLHFKQESFDALIKNQKDSLEGFSKYVIEGGKLLYIVDTLNKKESTSIIHDFLMNHKEFELENMEQLLPINKEDTTMFYAILKKKEKNA